MEIHLVLDTLEALESRMVELYETYCRMFADDSEASMLFKELVDEEVSHVNIVKYQGRLAKQNPKDFKGNPGVDLKGLDASISMVKSIITKTPPPSLREAVETAIKFERDAAEHHYRTAVAKSNPGVAELVRSLGTSDKEHLKRLETFHRKRWG